MGIKLTQSSSTLLSTIAAQGVIAILIVLVLLVQKNGTFDVRSVLPVMRHADPQHASQMKQREVRERFYQGVAMLQMGEYEHALTAFHRVLVLSPKLSEAHVNAGFALYELKDFRGAQKFFEGALALDASQINAEYGLAISLFELQQKIEAVHHMANYVRRLGNDDPYKPKAEKRLAEMTAALQVVSVNRSKDDKQP